MKIKYVGSRPCVSTVLRGRTSCYFGIENNYTVDVKESRHVTELLCSSQHRFEVVIEKPVEKTKEPKSAKKEEKKLGKGKKNG